MVKNERNLTSCLNIRLEFQRTEYNIIEVSSFEDLFFLIEELYRATV